MRIAVCDDDMRELTRMSSLLDAYREKTKAGFSFQIYSDGVALLEDVRRGRFDLLLLDIMMPLVDGIQIAEEVRSFDKEIKIVFLTSSKEFALESYSVGASMYLLKPATSDRLYPVLDRFFHSIRTSQEGLAVKFKNGVASVLFSSLAYVEVLNKTLLFHLSDGNVREATAALAEYEDLLLSRPEFVRVHRAFIVNLRQVQEMRSADMVTFAGRTVPVSRRHYPQVRDAYVELLFGARDAR